MYEVFTREPEEKVWDKSYKRRTVAQNKAKILSEETGSRWKIRRVPDYTIDWQSREQQRFDSGIYKKLPWFDEPWYTEEHHKQYYPHVADDGDAGMVALTTDQFKAEDDIKTVITPGRYLTKFFRDHLTDEQINDWVVKLQEMRWQLVILDQPKDIVKAYTSRENSGMGACMSHSLGHYSSHVHPTSVYGKPGDLSLALLKDVFQDKYVGRCLVYKDKKIYGRAYGHTSGIRHALEQQGYTNGSFVGAKLPVIRHGTDYVMPYIDGPQNGSGSYLALKGDWFYFISRDTESRYSNILIFGSTSGLAYVTTLKCDCCGDIVSTYTSKDDETVCYHCIEEGVYKPKEPKLPLEPEEDDGLPYLENWREYIFPSSYEEPAGIRLSLEYMDSFLKGERNCVSRFIRYSTAPALHSIGGWSFINDYPTYSEEAITIVKRLRKTLIRFRDHGDV